MRVCESAPVNSPVTVQPHDSSTIPRNAASLYLDGVSWELSVMVSVRVSGDDEVVSVEVGGDERKDEGMWERVKDEVKERKGKNKSKKMIVG